MNENESNAEDEAEGFRQRASMEFTAEGLAVPAALMWLAAEVRALRLTLTPPPADAEVVPDELPDTCTGCGAPIDNRRDRACHGCGTPTRGTAEDRP